MPAVRRMVSPCRDRACSADRCARVRAPSRHLASARDIIVPSNGSVRFVPTPCDGNLDGNVTDPRPPSRNLATPWPAQTHADDCSWTPPLGLKSGGSAVRSRPCPLSWPAAMFGSSLFRVGRLV